MAIKFSTSLMADNSLETPHAVSIGQRLPPVPKELASKIESGKFVGMYVRDCLGYPKTSTSKEKIGEPNPRKG